MGSGTIFSPSARAIRHWSRGILDRRVAAGQSFGQAGVRIIQAHGRVRVGTTPIKRLAWRFGVDANLGENWTDDGLTVVRGDRQVDQQFVVSGGNVTVPAAPKNRITLPHQEAISDVGSGRGFVASAIVKRAEHQFVAAVVHLVQQAMVAAADVNRFEQEEIGREETRPRALRGASVRSMTAALAAAFGSTSSSSRPVSFSYCPDVPKVWLPSGTRSLITSLVTAPLSGRANPRLATAQRTATHRKATTVRNRRNARGERIRILSMATRS